MSERTTFQLSSAEEAAGILDHFNGFHDGFIRRMVIDSQDRINPDLSQTCTGVFDVEIDFAHYNYPAGSEGLHPHNQMVRANFRNVQGLACEFGEGFLGNTILNLSVAPARRVKGGGTAAEPCLCLRLTRHFYQAGDRRYELKESQLFTFTDAEFVELDPASGHAA